MSFALLKVYCLQYTTRIGGGSRFSLRPITHHRLLENLKGNIYLIFLSKRANSIFGPVGMMTSSIPDMSAFLPQWTASSMEIKWRRKEEVFSNFEKDILRMVKERGKDITNKLPEEYELCLGEGIQ